MTATTTQAGQFFEKVRDGLEPYKLPLELVLRHYLREKGLTYRNQVALSGYLWVYFEKQNRRLDFTTKDRTILAELMQEVTSHFPELELSSKSEYDSESLSELAYTVKPRGLEIPMEIKNEMRKRGGEGTMTKRQTISARLSQLRQQRPDLVLSADWIEDVREAAKLIDVSFDDLKTYLKIK